MPARLLAIMGSGETTPTMVKVHRQIFEQLGPGRGPAVLVGTPYGFQGNAADISARTVAYFQQSIDVALDVVALPRPDGAGGREVEEALSHVAAASWVFSGPGSPTYAARQWRTTRFSQLLADKLAYGGAVVFSSAAAMTLGAWTVPVYEIYKVGGDVVWAQGLDILGPFGLNVAVVAHFDNAEGGNHDTRYCYLGEHRLRALEGQLPEGAWVLGVDEHTACVIDLETRTVTVAGLGTVTVRLAGRSAQVPAGESLPLDELIALARSLADGAGGGAPGLGTAAGEGQPATPAAEEEAADGGPHSNGAEEPGHGESPFLGEVRRLTASFDQAISDRDAGAAVDAVLALEEALHAWSADTAQSDNVDRARGVLRRMLARMGQPAAVGLREPRSVLGPWVSALLDERAQARTSKRFADSDRIRDRLAGLGVEVRDTPDGSQWELTSADKPPG